MPLARSQMGTWYTAEPWNSSVGIGKLNSIQARRQHFRCFFLQLSSTCKILQGLMWYRQVLQWGTQQREQRPGHLWQAVSSWSPLSHLCKRIFLLFSSSGSLWGPGDMQNPIFTQRHLWRPLLLYTSWMNASDTPLKKWIRLERQLSA